MLVILPELLGTGRRHEPTDEVRPLPDDAVQLPVLVPLDDARLGVGGGSVDPRQLEGERVDDGAMTAGPPNDDRVFGGRLVNISAKRPTPLRHLVLGPSPTRDPFRRAQLSGFGPDPVLEFLDGAGSREVDVPPRVPPDVDMGVVEAGRDEPTPQVDDPVCPIPVRQIVASHLHDAIAPDRHRLVDRRQVVGREDPPTDEEKVGLGRLLVGHLRTGRTRPAAAEERANEKREHSRTGGVPVKLH